MVYAPGSEGFCGCPIFGANRLRGSKRRMTRWKSRAEALNKGAEPPVPPLASRDKGRGGPRGPTPPAGDQLRSAPHRPRGGRPRPRSSASSSSSSALSPSSSSSFLPRLRKEKRQRLRWLPERRCAALRSQTGCLPSSSSFFLFSFNFKILNDSFLVLRGYN